MAVDSGGKDLARPVRFSPAEWLDHFTDFGRIELHPDPPFLRMPRVDPPTLRLARTPPGKPVPEAERASSS
jgi:hypothetical protein